MLIGQGSGRNGDYYLFRPAGVPFDATMVVDFVAGKAWRGMAAALSFGDAFACARASAGLAQDVAGAWVSFVSGAARITNAGLLIEPAATNKCTNTNANPTATADITKLGDVASSVSVVDDASKLGAAGLSAICTSGKVYKFDNSAGTAAAFFMFAGPTGSGLSGTIHSSSVYLRGSACLLALRSAVSGASIGGAGSTAASSDFQRAVRLSAPDGSTRFMGVELAAGAVVYAVLNQLELAGVSSPIIVAGAAGTRAADAVTLNLPAGTHNLTFTFDDGSTQVITGQSGTYAVPTNLNRRVIKSVIARAA